MTRPSPGHTPHELRYWDPKEPIPETYWQERTELAAAAAAEQHRSGLVMAWAAAIFVVGLALAVVIMTMLGYGPPLN